MGEAICAREGCQRSKKTRGYCDSHYTLARRSGELQKLPRPNAEERFWSKVNKSVAGGCWLWTATKRRGGYGSFAFKAGDSHLSHRLAYQWLVGPIPDGRVLDHLCRNRACVNPDHLEPVTQHENVHRGEGVAVRNLAKTHCPAGHPYTDENTYRDPRGGRYCRTCRAENGRRRRLRAQATN